VTASGSGDTVSVVSGAGGRYVLAGLRPGAYTVSYLDCARPAKYFEQWSGGADLASDAARVVVRASRPTRLAPVTLRLTSPAAEVAALRTQARRAGPAASRGDTVSGIVRSRSGHVLGRMCAGASMSTKTRGEIVATNTGGNGGYSLGIGTSGKWQVEFTGGCGDRGNYAPQWWRFAATPRKSTYLHARPRHNFRRIDASLRPGASISGVVTSRRSGQPLAHVCVVVTGTGAMNQIEMEATTGANGSYRIENLGTGRYHVGFVGACARTADYMNGSYPRLVAVTDGKTTTGINGSLASGGEIGGVVTSQASGAPLAGICVTISKDGFSDSGFEITSQTGRYSMKHLTAGRYQVSFTGGCGNPGSYAPQAYDGQPNPEGAMPIVLRAGQVLTDVGAAMLPGATVTGRAVSAAGAGLPGACVALISRNYAGALGQDPVANLLQNLLDTAPPPVGETGSAGRYRLVNVPPGQYAAEFIVGCGHGSAAYGSQVFAPQAPGTNWLWAGAGTVTAGVDTTLRPGGTITGVITGPGGRRLSGICPVAIDPATQGPISATPIPAITRRGVYRIRGLAAGRYAVGFVPCAGPGYAEQWYRRQPRESSATLVPVRTGRATTGINAAVVKGGRLSGRVLSGVTGRPVSRVCVFVAGTEINSTAPVIGPVGLSRRSGQYQVDNVPPGVWNLDLATCLTRSPLAGIVYHGVRVRNGVTHKVSTIRLPESGRLTGTVLGGTPATAQPGICVEATPVAGAGLPGTTATGRGGAYTLGGLAPGRYRVLFTPYCALGTAALTPARTSSVVVRAGHATTAGAQLAADGGIAGTVSAGARAAVGVCAGAFAPGSSSPAGVVSTGPGGRYELDGLAPGRYQVEFTAGCGDSGYPAQWYQGARTRGAARTVTVTAGSVTTGITEG
jgi:hypothetical protein